VGLVDLHGPRKGISLKGLPISVGKSYLEINYGQTTKSIEVDGKSHQICLFRMEHLDANHV
jgi:hypothetical protein